MFSYVSPEQRVTQDHPLRAIRQMMDVVFHGHVARFARLYSDIGRPSIPPEQLLRALLLQIFYTIRSERLFMEQVDYSILFRWFIGLSWTNRSGPTVFTKNRDRLLDGDRAAFFRRVVQRGRGLLSDEHFTVDSTMMEAWASLKSFQRKNGRPDGDGRKFQGELRKNETHASTTDPDARLYRRTNHAEARLAYLGHLLIENRHGLIADARATGPTGSPNARRVSGCCTS